MTLARHVRGQGAGVCVMRLWKAGSVDCQRAVELKGVDLEQYRETEREWVQIGVAACDAT